MSDYSVRPKLKRSILPEELELAPGCTEPSFQEPKQNYSKALALNKMPNPDNIGAGFG